MVSAYDEIFAAFSNDHDFHYQPHGDSAYANKK